MPKQHQITLGQRLRTLRHGAGWTLKQMSHRSGIPLSTLSKVERDKLSLRYDQLLRLASRLQLPPADLFSEMPPTSVCGRRSIALSDSTAFEPDGDYAYGYPCAELLQKRMTPILVRIKATQATARRRMARIAADEYLYVLEGSVEVATQHYAPVVLSAGDSLYTDSGTSATYAAAGGCSEAFALLVRSPRQYPSLQGDDS